MVEYDKNSQRWKNFSKTKEDHIKDQETELGKFFHLHTIKHMQTLQHKILIWSHYPALPKSAKFCVYNAYGSLNNNERPDKLCMRWSGELTKRTVKMEINMLIYHFMILQNNVK